MKRTSNRTKRASQLAMAAFAATLFVGVSWAGGSGPTLAVADTVAANGGVMMLNAVLHEDGKVTGNFDYVSGGGDVIVGFPTCLYVEGNSAYISGLVESGTFNGVDVTGESFNFRVDDNGIPGSNPPDGQGLLFFVNPAAGFELCNNPNFRAFYDSGPPAVDVVEGNINIKG